MSSTRAIVTCWARSEGRLSISRAYRTPSTLSTHSPYPPRLERPLPAESHAASGEDRVRLQPRAVRREAVVVGDDRVPVERVEEIHRHLGPLGAMAEVLREAEVELIDPIAVKRAGLDQIERDV